MSGETTVPQNRRYTREAENVAAGVEPAAAGFDDALIAFEDHGGFFELLRQSDFSLVVTREYEHFLLALDGGKTGPISSPFPLPHPSGACFAPETGELVVASTRTPNMLVWFAPYEAARHGAEILPADYSAPEERTVFLPTKARYLPGSLYIHDLVKMGDAYFATITGHNFLARLSIDKGWERVWWPRAADELGSAAFNQNYFQLNSIAAAGTPETSFYTAFSELTSGPKPWKEGYGPEGRGVVFSGETRTAISRGLTCPHSARFHQGRLWVCNSGFGSVGYIDDHGSLDPGRTRYVEVARVPGFTRGLAFSGDVMFVGLSKVIPKYEPYAPGLVPADTRCGIWALEASTGKFLASVTWPAGYQIYDVQVMPGIKHPMLPLLSRPSDGINPLLRFLG
ncbi:MAG: DUF4915 domain-containing protein [Devosia sp.]|nr:DUF4915 domain-containing protein [Devosia sp.]